MRVCSRRYESWLTREVPIKAPPVALETLERLLLPRGVVPAQSAPRRYHVVAVLFWPGYILVFGWMAVAHPAKAPPSDTWLYIALMCAGSVFAMNSGGILLWDRHRQFRELARWLWVLAALVGLAVLPLAGLAFGGPWLAVAGALASCLLVVLDHALHRGLIQRLRGGSSDRSPR